MALGLQRRITELLEWLDAERGGDRQSYLDEIAVRTYYGGDVSFFGPIQSTCQIRTNGPIAAVAAVFSAITFQAGPKGAWIMDIQSGGVGAQTFRVSHVVNALANQILVTVQREDLAVPGLIPTVLEPFAFGSTQYGAASPLPLGGVLIGGTLAAPSAGYLIATSIERPRPLYVPPGAGITCCGITANTTIEPQLTIIESLQFLGRNFGDRPGV